MVEPTSVPPQLNIPEPTGPVKFAWFDGILSAPLIPVDALRDAVESLNRLNLCTVLLHVEAGRFSIMFENQSIPGERFTRAAAEDFRRYLQDVFNLLPANHEIESTLRCTEVFEKETRETLFAALGNQLNALSRVRPVNAADLQHDPTPQLQIPLANMSRRTVFLMMGLLLVAFGLMAWQSGWLDRMFSAKSEAIKKELGAFEGLLSFDSSSDWGNYSIKVKRGKDYPETKEQVSALLDRASTAADRAVINAVADGSTVYLRLENLKGKVLVAKPVNLRALLTDEKTVVEVELPGRMDADVMRLALDEGLKEK